MPPPAPAPSDDERAAAYAAALADVATLAAGYGDGARIAEAPGCWALRLPLPYACANLGVLRLADAASVDAALAFAGEQFDDTAALVCLALDGLGDPDAARAAFARTGWRVSESYPYLQLGATEVPALEDTLAIAELRTPRDMQQAHAIVAAAGRGGAITAPEVDETLRYTRTQPEHTVYGAWVDGAMVSTIRAVRRAQHCGLYLAATDPAHQRRGYGGALLDRALHVERERGALTFHAFGGPGLSSLCEAAGFRTIGQVAYAIRDAAA